MPSKLKERLERLGPVRDVDRVASGSAVDLVLRPALQQGPEADVKSIDATMALARRGMSLLRAKRAIEAMLDDGEVAVQVPTVEDLGAFMQELRAAGVAAVRIATDPLDVRGLRQSLGLSQEQFARRFNLDLDALQNWEQGRRSPDRAVWSYLRVIAVDPQTAARAQEVASPVLSTAVGACQPGFAEDDQPPLTPATKPASRRHRSSTKAR